MKKERSISFVFLRHQIIFAVLIILTLVVSSILLYRAQWNSLRKDYVYQTERSAERTSALMERQEDYMTEIFWSIVNNYDGLWSEVNDRRYFDKQKVKSLFADRKIYDPSLQMVFCTEPDRFMVFQGGEDLRVDDRLAIQDYIRTHYNEIGSVRSAASWKLREIDGRFYCFYCCSYQEKNLHIGLALEVSQMLSSIREDFAGKTGSFRFSDASGNEYLEFFGENSGRRRIELEPVKVRSGLTLSTSMQANLLRLESNSYVMIILTLMALCFFWCLIVMRLIRREIMKPVIQLSSEVQEIQSFDGSERVSETAETSEMRILQQKINQFLQEVVWEKMSHMSLMLKNRDQELLMLRTQLKPHFFLNAITTVSAMTYQDRNEDIREYLNALSAYIQYLILPQETVRLEQELESIGNYIEMMEIRYPDQAAVFIDCRKEIGMVRIPHLMLLTVVENCYKYALNLEEILQIMITCGKTEDETFSGTEIVIEDNGPGFSEEQLASGGQPDGNEGHIGLRNIISTLEIRYGREDLFRIRNVEPHGAAVTILIPDQEKAQYEASDNRG